MGSPDYNHVINNYLVHIDETVKLPGLCSSLLVQVSPLILVWKWLEVSYFL